MTDRDLEGAQQLTNVESLGLGNVLVTDECMSSIEKMPNLKKLSLTRNGSSVNDGSSVCFRKNVLGVFERGLISAGPYLTQRAIGRIGRLVQLQKLQIESMPVGQNGFEAWKDLDECTLLMLRGTQLTDQNVATLSEMEKIKILWVDDTQVSLASRQTIMSFPALERFAIEDRFYERYDGQRWRWRSANNWDPNKIVWTNEP